MTPLISAIEGPFGGVGKAELVEQRSTAPTVFVIRTAGWRSVASALRIHNPLGGLFGNCGVSGQLGPNLAPVITQVFSANNAGAKPLNGYALLNRHATRFPVADGSGRNVQLFSHNRAAAKVAGGPVKRVLAWNDGKRIDLHSRILTRGVFIGQHHMFTQPVFNAAT